MTNNSLRQMSSFNVPTTGNYMAYPDQLFQNLRK
jgi:hypothetical protein